MQEIAQYPPTFIPETFYWRNYLETWTAAPFTRYTMNTLLPMIELFFVFQRYFIEGMNLTAGTKG
ncbi:hypothetical protein [Paenibacillus typhae]|uniref:Multiple sugar transport system permease protein/sn-glycerol 3-phosphate transport system permease protein n=1 Tax=Paenibacillus typhae TaxID=1174501 RepID=A0A1G8TCS5_9BACL|nr:hypothetical protein [Paenibacillus typhae]SDJ38715.1 multiple sugar transport system permease protein/sn-glycerol 3-phosphate transport system permease protein [Paenibacillus typhae]